MNRRRFHRTFLGAAALASGRLRALAQTPQPFEPSWISLRAHQIPSWFQNAKLGIFIHWGLYSVPAWAPPTGELGKVNWNEWFTNNPYAEWYLNTLRIEGSPTYKHHIETYGANFDYYDFAKTFNENTAQWDPNSWAALFQKTGARYVVLTTKHHDGFTLWPSKVPNPKRLGRPVSSSRDLARELTEAVRSHGMKMGLYYSGGLDWTFTTEPIRNPVDLFKRVPQTEEYAAYADAHWRELVDRYKPSVMWNDISYPKTGNLEAIFAEYYNKVPDGVINNRFGVEFSDFTTPEYSKYDKITDKKWESCRGLGFSFGYNRQEGPEHVLAPDKLIALFVDIVSKNGNLLLNIGPKPDGSISDIQLDRLSKLGDWLALNGEGIFDSRPWVRPSARTADGVDIRFTRKSDSAYAFFLDRPKQPDFTLPGILATEGMKVTVLGNSQPVEWKQLGTDLAVRSPHELPAQFALKLTPAPSQVARD
jgi:alpha-L-fucosidase